jgi:two-component system sensor histidine kinase AlgZ
MHKTDTRQQHFLPDFGSLGIALRLVLFAELIAIVITIGRNETFDARAWQDFNLLSAFALGVTLATLVVLKLASPLLRRVSVVTGSLVVVLLVLIITAVATDGLIFALYDLRLIPDRWPEWRESLLVRSLLIALIVSVLGLRYAVLQHRADADARLRQDASLQALQARIRPHFLFNSLNSVASLTRSDPPRAEAVLHDLADLFRELMRDARKLVPLAAEREISRQYLEIEKLRLGERLKVRWKVGELPRNVQIPALTLQPLLENAIYHGIEPRFAGGTITIEMWTEARTLNIMISNPLPEVAHKSHSGGNKIAMDNIRLRLATQFGERATLQTFEEGGLFHVKLKLPVTQE